MTLTPGLMIVAISALAVGLLTLLYKIYSVTKDSDRFDEAFDYRYFSFNRLFEKVEASKKGLTILQTELLFAEHSRSIDKFILALDYLKFEMDEFRASDVARVAKRGNDKTADITSVLYNFENQYIDITKRMNLFMNDINSSTEA